MHTAMANLQRDLSDGFDIVRPLGDSALAEVFLARERKLDRPVAIKVLRRSRSIDEAARKRFLKEARLAARIRHPNVVSVYRVGELASDGRPYLVMEYIDGRTFQEILEGAGPLLEDEVRQIIGEVCGGLAAAHSLDVIHRDVRPANIMRTRDGGRVVLTDFGVAGILETGGEAKTRLTRPGEILGDVWHAPPEQLKGETIRPGSDVYAVAVTAYELLTGAGPFPYAKKAAGEIQAHLTGEPVPIRRLCPAVTPELEDILLRCLHILPDQRPSADLLRKRLAGDLTDSPRGAVESFLAELRRRRVYKVGVAYGAFILVVLAVVDGALPALPFELPAVAATAMVTAALAGLPLALILGWFFDLAEGGVERTRARGPGAQHGLRLVEGGALVLILAVTGLLGWYVLSR